jgi:hypothetical protein
LRSPWNAGYVQGRTREPASTHWHPAGSEWPEWAAEGRPNAEIAQELFASLKTVETHPSHAYKKLALTGAGAREQLAGELS